MSKWQEADYLMISNDDGFLGAVFDSERLGMVRVSAFSSKFAQSADDDWREFFRFNAATGQQIDDMGRVIENGYTLEISGTNLLTDFDLSTRKPKTVTLSIFEYRNLLDGGGGTPVPTIDGTLMVDFVSGVPSNTRFMRTPKAPG